MPKHLGYVQTYRQSVPNLGPVAEQGRNGRQNRNQTPQFECTFIRDASIRVCVCVIQLKLKNNYNVMDYTERRY